MSDFEMIWLSGKKYMVSAALAAAVKEQIEKLQKLWQIEHDEKVRLEERLKLATAKVAWLEEESEKGEV